MGEIVAAALTERDEGDAAQVGPLLDRVDEAVASFTAYSVHDQSSTCDDVLQSYADAAAITSLRAMAAPTDTAQSTPTQRGRLPHRRAAHGHMRRQKASGYNARVRAEATVVCRRQVIGDGL
jgi:hypothetical protein